MQLDAARLSVNEQRGFQFDDHLVQVDHNGLGAATVRNALAANVKSEWILFLDDDDTLSPNYGRTMLPTVKWAPDEVAVVYSAWEVVGDVIPAPWLKFEPEAILAGHNHVPVTACVRTAVFREMGGFRADVDLEDLDLWQRLLRAGYEFEYVPTVLWQYRRESVDSRNRKTMNQIRRDGCPTCGYKTGVEM